MIALTLSTNRFDVAVGLRAGRDIVSWKRIYSVGVDPDGMDDYRPCRWWKLWWAPVFCSLVVFLREANSGLYFRANPPTDNPDGFPRGYEAQICKSGDAFTGWLWKPGKPTGKATELLTKDGEWFSLHIRAVGEHIQIWINDKLVMTYDDPEYKSGHFAIQGHNPGMKIEAKNCIIWI